MDCRAQVMEIPRSSPFAGPARPTVWCFMLLLFLSALSCGLILTRHPMHAGRSLEYWLRGLDANVAEGRSAAAQDAIRSMVPGVFPVLASMLEARDSRFREALTAIASIVPGMRRHVSGAQDMRNRARRAFLILGPRAVEPLADLLTNGSPGVRHPAILLLSDLGPAASPAVGALTRVMKDPDLGDAAVRALGAIGRPASAAAPEIVRWLARCEDTRGFAAVQALRAMQPESRALLPEVVAIANDSKLHVSARAIAVVAARDLAPGEADRAGLSAEALQIYESTGWQRRPNRGGGRGRGR